MQQPRTKNKRRSGKPPGPSSAGWPINLTLKKPHWVRPNHRLAFSNFLHLAIRNPKGCILQGCSFLVKCEVNLHLPGRPPPSLLFKTPVALGECLVEPVVLVRNHVSSLGKNSCLNQTKTGAMGMQPATFVMSFACPKKTAPGGLGGFSTHFFWQPGIHAKINGKSEHNRASILF